MSDEQLLRKKAVDKEGKKLGHIVQIDNLPGKIIKKEVPHAFILDKDFLDGKILVPIEASRIIEITDEFVSFDILKVEFEKEADKQRVIKKQREFSDSQSTYEVRTRAGLSPYTRNLPRSKNRRR